jgi:outer membrane protein assembly factor BamB
MSSNASSWWMFHGDASHSGMAAGSDINSANASSLKLLHDIPIPGPILSVPALVGGNIYAGIANTSGTPGIDGGQFLKIDAANGSVLARFEWQVPLGQGDTHGFMGMGCTPAISGGCVYFSAFNGKFYCLSQDTLELIWVVDLRNPDPAHDQPVSNTLTWNAGDPNAAGWSSPVVANGKVYVGMGEGENPALFGFIFCLDAATGNVIWIYCTCHYDLTKPNLPNVLPSCVVPGPFSSKYSISTAGPVRGCSIWSSIAYDEGLDRIFFTTGNPQPDGSLPTAGFSNGILSLDASTGEYRGFFQALPTSSYRPSDNDVDFGGSATLYTLPDGRRAVVAGCKNGGFFLLDAGTMQLIKWRQLLPLYNDGSQIPTVDPHVPGDDQRIDPWVSNEDSNKTPQENFYGTYSTPAVHPGLGKLYIGVGGNNYHNVAAGIDAPTTPFMRVMDWVTLDDAWEMDGGDPRRYVKPQPPMYTTPGESGLSSPAVVNDVVFFSTSIIAIYAFNAKDGTLLWQDRIGDQTGGANGGYGYCLGPAVEGNLVVAGGLVFGGNGGFLRVYTI